MSRKTSSILWLCLLLLLPVSVVAQTLEYWFDDDFDNRSSVSIATETEQELSLNLQNKTQFPPGFHKLNMRAIVGGKPTAVSSSDVLKIAAGDISLLEYWVDDDRDNVRTIGGKEANTGGSWQFLSDFDLSDVPVGFHYLHCRAVSNSRLTATAVTTTGFFKMPSGVVTHLQYWIDNDITNAKTIEGKEANTGGSWQFLSNLDLSAVSPGFHKLNCRAVSTNNQLMSSVSSTGFYKNALGNITHIEYWLDNDRKNIQTVAVNASEDGSTFGYIKDFNLTTASPGHHKVHFRAVSADRKTTSAVTTTAVVVKSRYNVDNPDDLKVVHQAYWVDDGEQDIRSVSKPRHDIDQPYVLDARKLSTGQHTFYMQFQNSAGIWNAPVASTFTKVTEVVPVIVAHNEVADGVVTVQFSTMPFGEKYVLVRKYPSGKTVVVDKAESAEYPAKLSTSDTPAPGTYTYYVEGGYTDFQGEVQYVRSDEMSVTVEAAAETVKKGTVTGVLLTTSYSPDDYYEQQNNYYKPSYRYDGNYRIYVNGEFLTSKGAGTFRIPDVAYGTELNIRIEDTEYAFNEVNIMVNETTCNNIVFFKGRRHKDSDVQPDNLVYDLDFKGDIHVVPNGFEVIVGNKSYLKWKGNLIARIVRKKDKDKYDEAMSSDGSSWSWSDLWPWSNNVIDEVVYTTAVNMHVELGPWSTDNHLTLSVKDLPDKDKAEDYYVYLYSLRDNSEQEKELDGFNGPRVLKFNPSDYTTGGHRSVREYLDAFMEVVKYMKKVEKWSDPFETLMNSLDGAMKVFLTKYSEGNLDLDDNEVDMYINNLIDFSISTSGVMVTQLFRGLYKKIKKAKDFQLTQMVHNMEKIYSTIESFQQASQADEYTKFFYTAKAVLSLTDNVFKLDPFFNIYKTYFDVGIEIAKNIDKLTNRTDAYNLWERLASGKGIYRIRVRKYTGNKDKEYFWANEFYQRPNYYMDNHPGQIQSIEIKLKDVKAQCPDIHSTSMDIEWESDYSTNHYWKGKELVIRNVEFNTNNYTGLYECEAWMIITWKNGRVMRVPLLNKNFVKAENLKKTDEEPIFTIELQSETYQNKENIANNISYVKP